MPTECCNDIPSSPQSIFPNLRQNISENPILRNELSNILNQSILRAFCFSSEIEFSEYFVDSREWKIL